MLKIKTFVCNMLQENCYVVSDETCECVIIDCGAYYEEERRAIVDYIHGNGLQPMHLLCTHGHLDHNFGNNTIYEAFALAPEVHQGDEKMMSHLERQAESFYGMQLNYEMPPVGKILSEEQPVTFGLHTWKVIETPGHSRGSVCFYDADERVLFAGDTLFRRSIGRTDLMDGSMLQIIQSLRMLAQLPDETTVYCGHGPMTTIGDELRMNPYMDR